MDEQEWTPLGGLRRALVRLAVRSGVAVVLWTAAAWLMTPVLNILIPHWSHFALLMLFALVPGVAIGHGLSKKLTEAAGMVSLILTAVAVLFGLGVVFAGMTLATLIQPIGEWQYRFTMFATGFWTTAWIIRATLMES